MEQGVYSIETNTASLDLKLKLSSAAYRLHPRSETSEYNKPHVIYSIVRPMLMIAFSVQVMGYYCFIAIFAYRSGSRVWEDIFSNRCHSEFYLLWLQTQRIIKL